MEAAKQELESMEEVLQSEELLSKYLTFRTDGQLFGLCIASVEQIVGVQQIAEIPDFPVYAKGVINLRGELIPVIDIRLRFGKLEIPYNDRTCIIVTRISGNQFGFIVDEVDEVTDIVSERISKPPKVGNEVTNQYLTGLARLEAVDNGPERIVLLIDTAKILGELEFAALHSAIE